MKKQRLGEKSEDLGRRIARLRRRKKLMQVDLASATGLTQTHISLLENGKRGISMTTLQKIAKALGVKANELLPF